MNNLKRGKRLINIQTFKKVRKALIMLLTFTVIIVNIPAHIVKALSASFDFENSTGLVNGYGTHTVTQDVNGETLIAFSARGNLMSNNSLSGTANIGTNSLATDGTASETSVTFSLVSGKAFDLASINFGDYSATNESINITSSKGLITTGPITNTSTDFDVSKQTNASFFKGITSFTLTAEDGAINGMAFDNIILDNIMPMLSTVTDVSLSSSGVATWNNVDNESNFEIQLYKDNNLQGGTITEPANTLSHNFLEAMRAAGVGTYTVKVTAKGDGTNYSDGLQSLPSEDQRITKLATVTGGLTWTGDVAHWTTVPNAVSYDVQLYRDENPLNKPINVPYNCALTGADFTSAIAAAGGGTYTYKVTAKADTTTLFLDAEQSGASSNNTKVTQLAQVTNVALSSTGVASWDAVPNASSYEVELFKGVSSGGKAVMVSGASILPVMRLEGAGAYTIKVTAKGNGSTYSDGPQSAISGSQTIVQIATVTDGLIWAQNVAHWTTVPNAVKYGVQLYKDGNPLNSPINVAAGSAVSGVDFTAAITGVGGGGGTYTYKVTAEGDGLLLLDATQSNFSNGNLVAPPLPQVTNVALSSTGVASWDNVDNEIKFEVQLYKNGSSQGAPIIEEPNVLSHDFLADMRAAGVGIYTVTVTAKGDGNTYSNGPQSAISARQIIAKLAIVTDGLTWTGDVAHWVKVPSAASYDVQLYRNGTALNSPINVAAGSALSSVDFTAAIAAGGGGIYTYKVTAKSDTATLFLDANQSAESDDNIKTVSSDATLSGLSISSGAFNESFASGTTAYTASVGNEVSSITVTPTVNESHATVTVAGSAVTSGQPSSVVLNVGTNTISVVVTAQDGTTKTYTITITRAAAPYIPPYIPPTPQPTTETRQVPVIVDNGNQQSTAVQTTITRTTDTSGVKTDTVKFDENTAAEVVKKASEAKSTGAVIDISDTSGNSADNTEFQLPAASISEFANNNMSLSLKTEKAALEIPTGTIEGLSGQDAAVKISEEKDSSKIENNKALVLKVASGSDIISAPLNIEANYTGRTKISIPIDSSKLPSSKEELDKFFSSLAVMVHHSDGEDVVDKGTIVYDEKGKVTGIAIWVDKFSSFTLIEIPENYFQGKTTVIQDKVAADKEWNIKFTKAADAATVTKDNVYVVDSKGNKVDVKVSYGSDNILKVVPVNPYTSGETYYLYITKAVKAKDKTALVNELRYQFIIK